MTSKRELQLAVLLCLVGSLLVVVAVGLTWLSIRFPSELTSRDVTASVSGAKVVGGARLLGYVGLGGVVAVAATRGRGRAVVGVVLVLVAIGIGVTVVDALADGYAAHAFPADLRNSCQSLGPQDCVAAAAAYAGIGIHEHHVWAGLTFLGAALLAASGVLVLARGRQWEALGSSYEVPAARPADVTDKGVWDALDAGDDPTA